MRHRTSLRRRLTMAAVATVALALAVTAVVFNIALRRALLADATDQARATARAHAAVLDAVDGRLAPEEQRDLREVDPGPVWTVSPSGVVAGPSAADGVMATIRRVAATDVPESTTGLRLAAVPLTVAERPAGRVVAGQSLSTTDSVARTAMWGSAALVLVALVAVAAVARALLRSALDPVARMTADAAAWSETDLERRFAHGATPRELDDLASTLNGLLERIAASLRRERRLTSEISHELRTPLARIRAHAELGAAAATTPEMRDAFDGVLRAATHMGTTLDALLEAGRAQTAREGRCDAVAVVTEALRHVRDDDGASAVHVDLNTGTTPLPAAVAAPVLERALSPVLANALRYARTRVEVRVAADGARVAVHVVDDGPGIDADEADEVFLPGRRGAAGLARGDGAGLGLTLARRLARAAGGDVVAAPAATGAHLVLTVPRVP